MKKNITGQLKKSIVLIALIILCGFILSICTAGSVSNRTADSNDIQSDLVQQKENLLTYDPNSIKLSEFNSTEIFHKIMLAVVLVFVMGIAAIFMTKKYLPKIANFSGKEIRVIETVHLGPRKSVHLLEVGKRRLLIASTNENISRLADLTEFSTDMANTENESENDF